MIGILFSLRILLRCEESEVHELHFDPILGILVTFVHTGDVGPDGACEPNITEGFYSRKGLNKERDNSRNSWLSTFEQSG